MAAVVNAVTGELSGSVLESAARWIASVLPDIAANLSRDEAHKLAKAVIGQKLASELAKAADVVAVDYAAERETFLAHAGRSGSVHTARRMRRP